tara:strand:- start:447 stop:1442 length:996 start_codon:yes stop_codon:yes gene_type:complete
MASIQKINKIWHLNYVDENGKRSRPSLKTKNKVKAEVKLRQFEHEQYVAEMQGIKIAKKAKYFEYSKIYLDWFEKNYPSSFITKRDNFVNHLDNLFGDIYIQKLTNEKVDNFIDQLKDKNLRPATINTILKDLRALLNHAKKAKYAVPDFRIYDVADLDSKPPKYHSADDLKSIYEHAPNHWHWWKLLANTGMRLGELKKLETANVFDDAIHVISTNKARTKSGKWRVIGLNDDAQEALAAFDRSNKYLLPATHRSTVGTALTRACKRAGISPGKYGVHCLRHSFGSHLAMAGVSMRAIQILMGHANSKTTERYAHLSPKHLKDSVNRISL